MIRARLLPRALACGALLYAMTGCLTPGDEPYAGWSEARSVDGGFSLRYLAPPWEKDLSALPPAIGLQIPFQHAAPVGLPDPPPSFAFLATPGLIGPTDALSQNTEAQMEADDVLIATTRPFTTRSGLAGHEMIKVDKWSRYHRETFVALPSGSVVHLSLESNDDADQRDVDDLFASLEAIE